MDSPINTRIRKEPAMVANQEFIPLDAVPFASRMLSKRRYLNLLQSSRWLIAMLMCVFILMPAAAYGNSFLDKLNAATQEIKKIDDALHEKSSPQTSPTKPNAPTQSVAEPSAGQKLAAKPPGAPGDTRTATMTEKTVGPIMTSTDSYTVSRRGAHLATLNMHGSRFVVTVDGIDCPRVNAVFGSVSGYSGAASQKRAVAMSEDGQHYAYVARMGHKMVVFADGTQRQRSQRAALSDFQPAWRQTPVFCRRRQVQIRGGPMDRRQAGPLL